MIFNPEGKDKFKMTSPDVIRRYITCESGVVTLVNTKTLKAHSYAFRRPKDRARFAPETVFVYTNHEEHDIYTGILDERGFRRTAHSRFLEDSEAVKGVRYIIKMSKDPTVASDPRMALYHDGRCCKCGRRLTSDKAIRDGIGRKCREKLEFSLIGKTNVN